MKSHWQDRVQIPEGVLQKLETLGEPEVPGDLEGDARSAWINGWGTCWLKIMDAVKGRPDTTRVR